MSKKIKPGDTAILRCMDFERKVVVVCRDTDDSSVFVVRAADEMRTDYWPVDGKYLHGVDDYATEFERVHSACKEWHDREFAAMVMETVESVAKQIGSPFDAFRQDGSSWYDYETRKALSLPPVGTKCIYLHDSLSAGHEVDVLEISSDETFAVVSLSSVEVNKITFYARVRQLVPLDYATSKAEVDRQRVIKSAMNALPEISSSIVFTLNMLYELGYLRMPADKD